MTTGRGARLRWGADVEAASAAKPADKTHRIMATFAAFVATWPSMTAGRVAFGLVVAVGTAEASLGFEP